MEGLSKTPDETKKDLQHCSQRTQLHCLDCSHDGESFCTHKLTADALAYIQQLEADNAQLNRCIENMTDKLNAAHDETVELKRERDALLTDLRATDPCDNCKHCDTAHECNGDCSFCDHSETCQCLECDTDSHWEWAGIKEATP